MLIKYNVDTWNCEADATGGAPDTSNYFNNDNFSLQLSINMSNGNLLVPSNTSWWISLWDTVSGALWGVSNETKYTAENFSKNLAQNITQGDLITPDNITYVTSKSMGGDVGGSIGAATVDNTKCTGSTDYLDGTGTCDDISGVYVQAADWTTHDNYAAGCTNQFVRDIDDTLTCASVDTADIANDAIQEGQIDFGTGANQVSLIDFPNDPKFVSNNTPVKFTNITTTDSNNTFGAGNIGLFNSSCWGFRKGTTGGWILSCDP